MRQLSSVLSYAVTANGLMAIINRLEVPRAKPVVALRSSSKGESSEPFKRQEPRNKLIAVPWA